MVEDGEDGESTAVLYHCMNNSRHLHAAKPGAGAAATEQQEQQGGEEQGPGRREGKAPAEEAENEAVDVDSVGGGAGSLLHCRCCAAHVRAAGRQGSLLVTVPLCFPTTPALPASDALCSAPHATLFPG